MKNIKKKLCAATAAFTVAVSGMSASFASGSLSAKASDINFGDALKMSLYFYDANKCGNDVTGKALTWRGNCHTYDSEASLNSAEGLSAASKAAIKEANGGLDTVDVSGGYHDAGDHLKFTVTMGFSAMCLGWSYFNNPDSYKKTGSEAHLLEILKENADYFMKTTYLDSNDEVVTFCYMVGADEDHSIWTSPEVQTYNRKTYWADASHPSADAAAESAAALATISLAFADKNAAYSAECLKYAKALQKFASKYPSASYDGIGSYYGSGSQEDDVAFSEVWVKIAENGGTLPSDYTPKYTPKDGVYNGSIYDYWVFSWDKVWGGYAALLSQFGVGGSTYTNEVKFEMDKLVNNLSQSYYPVGGGWGASRYNCAWQMYALEYARATGNDSYNEYAKKQMEYLLGNNPQGRSYLLGYGDTWPVNIHHRAANPDKAAAKYTLYGALVGGPTDASGSYEDKTDSYSCTEPALDYNGCFALAIAGLYSVYGGSTDAVDKTISTASEINSDYVFSYGGNENPTEPTTETTTTDNTIYESEGFLDLDSKPIKTTYSLNEKLDLSGLTVSLIYLHGKDGRDVVLDKVNPVDNPLFKIDTSDFDNTKAGTYEIKVELTDSNYKLNYRVVSNIVNFEVEVTDKLVGDINSDGQISVSDVVLLQKYILKFETFTKEKYEIADINSDNKVNVIDLALLKEKLN